MGYKVIKGYFLEDVFRDTAFRRYFSLTLSSQSGSICPSGLFIPFMHRTLVTPVPKGKGVNYLTT